MFKILEYYGRFQGVRGRIGGLPSWARAIIGIAAIPGAVLIALSILALLVSILALLLLTVPLYRALVAVFGTDSQPISQSEVFRPENLTSPGRKKVDVTIIE